MGSTLQEDIDSYRNYINHIILDFNEYTPFGRVLFSYVIIFDEINSSYYQYTLEEANKFLDVILQNLYITKLDEDHWNTLRTFIINNECSNVTNDQLKYIKDYIINLFTLVGNA